MGWWITLGVLILLAFFPLGISLRYRQEKLTLQLRLAGIRIPLNLDRLLSGKEEKKTQPEKNQSAAEAAPQTPKPKRDLKKTYERLKPWISLGLDFLGDLRRKLRIDHLDLNLVLGCEDPCDLAILYGSTCAAMGNIIAYLERILNIRKRDIQVQCDFEDTKTRAEARLELSITLGRALVLLVGYGIRALREMRSMNNRKGGALL